MKVSKLLPLWEIKQQYGQNFIDHLLTPPSHPLFLSVLSLLPSLPPPSLPSISLHSPPHSPFLLPFFHSVPFPFSFTALHFFFFSLFSPLFLSHLFLPFGFPFSFLTDPTLTYLFLISSSLLFMLVEV